MSDEPPPILGYATVDPEPAWAEGEEAYFEFRPPSPIASLLALSVWLMLATLLAFLFVRASAVLLLKRKWEDEFVAPTLFVIGMSLAASYWSISGLRYLVRAARFRDAAIVVELSPERLRVENPVAWGDVSFAWEREEIYSLNLQNCGLQFGTARRGYALDVVNCGKGERTTIRFTSDDRRAIDDLRDAIGRFVPRR